MLYTAASDIFQVRNILLLNSIHLTFCLSMLYNKVMKRRLPIGIQDFAKICKGNYVYADKTACIHQLITGFEGAFFLSRQRRFGKSLLCSTLGAIFEGRRELFKGLAIDSLEWEWKKHPGVAMVAG